MEFCKGDIVINNYAGEKNPFRYLVYLRKGTIRQGRYSHKTYECIGYDGKIAKFFRDDSQFEKVGHMDEFDAFLYALNALKDMESPDDGTK